jgi:hypothetical protein
MIVTYYVIVPFDWDDAGALSAGQAQEASNAFAAERGARAIDQSSSHLSLMMANPPVLLRCIYGLVS